MWNDTREVIRVVRHVQSRRPATVEAIAEKIGVSDLGDLEHSLEAMVDKGLLESIVLMTRNTPAETWRLRRRSYQVVVSDVSAAPADTAPTGAAERTWGARSE